MALLLEIFLSGVRIVFLLTTSLLVFIFGYGFYTAVNSFLLEHYLPTLETIILLVAFVPVITFLYGVHIRKYFWQRQMHYNLMILVISFLFGLGIMFFPLATCGMQVSVLSQLTYGLGTGVITMVLAYIGMDLGVVVKHVSVHVLSEKRKHRKKTTSRRK